MKLRLATIDDARQLFEWQNDSLTLAMSVNSDPVEWDDHVGWLTERLSRAPPDLFIAELNGTSVGTVRLDDDEISYTVAPEHRGKGIATSMLIEAHRQFGPKLAKIKPHNLASIQAARKAGHTVQLLD